LGVFETPFWCREQAENSFTGESNKRELIREHVPVLKSHTTSAGGVKRTNKNQHGDKEETFSNTPKVAFIMANTKRFLYPSFLLNNRSQHGLALSKFFFKSS
jgi:hypothetical protein